MNTKGITIKVTTSKVIALLEDKLKVAEKEFADYPAIEQKYNAAVKVWEQKCVSIALKNSSKAIERTIVEDWNHGGSARATFWFPQDLFPPKPERPQAVSLGRYTVEREVEELRDIIRMLKLHEGDSISTATYKSVARFL